MTERQELQRRLTAEAKPCALVFSLASKYFSDDDDICTTAGTHIAEQLGTHLQEHGHNIPEWIQGGCKEDWGVYLESQKDDVRYQYQIMFFPRDDDTQSMAVVYGIKVGLWRRLFRGQPEISIDDPLNKVLREFGIGFERVELLTQKQFDEQY